MGAYASQMDLEPYPTPSVSTIEAFGNATHSVLEPLLTPFEAFLRGTAPGLCSTMDQFVKDNAHEFSAGMPLMSPYTVLFSLTGYIGVLLLLVAVSKALPKMELRLFGILHNLFLTVLSAYMCAGFVYEAVAGGFTLWNNDVAPPGPRRTALGVVTWIYVASKIPEFIDTFMMALKHNYRQITFLHVYHHCSVLIIGTVGFLVAPGGDIYWGGALNSGIHVPMYAYYMLNLMFPSGPVRKFLNNYKFFITYGQLTQFVLIMLHAAHNIFWLTKETRRYTYGYSLFLGGYAVTLLVLFMNFLIVSKLQRRKDLAKKSK